MLTVDSTLSDVPQYPATTTQIPRAMGKGQLVVRPIPSQTPSPAWNSGECGTAPRAPLLFHFQGFLHYLVPNSCMDRLLVRASEARNRGQIVSSFLIVMGLGPDSLRVINKNPGKGQLCLTRR